MSYKNCSSCHLEIPNSASVCPYCLHNPNIRSFPKDLEGKDTKEGAFFFIGFLGIIPLLMWLGMQNDNSLKIPCLVIAIFMFIIGIWGNLRGH